MKKILCLIIIFFGCKSGNEFLLTEGENYFKQNIFVENDFFPSLSFDVDADSDYYMVDPYNMRILIFNKQLNLINAFGRKGAGPGEFKIEPQYIKVAFDKIYIKTVFGINIYDRESLSFEREVRDTRISSDIAINFKDSVFYVPYFGYANGEREEAFSIFDYRGNKLKSLYINRNKFNKIQGYSERTYISLINNMLFLTFGQNSKIYSYTTEGKFLNKIDYGKEISGYVSQVEENKKGNIPYTLQSVIQLANNIIAIILYKKKNHVVQAVCFNEELKFLGKINFLKEQEHYIGIFKNDNGGIITECGDTMIVKFNIDTLKLKQMLEIE